MSLLPLTGIVWICHSMSNGFKQRLLATASYLGVKCHIILGGIQNEHFVKCWQKRVKLAQSMGRDIPPGSDMSNTDANDKGEESDDDLQDNMASTTSSRFRRTGLKISSTPKLGSSKKVTRFLQSPPYVDTTDILGPYGGRVQTRLAARQQVAVPESSSATTSTLPTSSRKRKHSARSASAQMRGQRRQLQEHSRHQKQQQRYRC